MLVMVGIENYKFFKRFIHDMLVHCSKICLFIICKYTVAVFRHPTRGRQISLWMVVSHHVIAGNLNSETSQEQSVLLTTEPSLQPE